MIKATTNTQFYPGQKVRVTWTYNFAAVYDRKGNIINGDEPGIKSTQEGIVEYVGSECITESYTIVLCKSTSKKKALREFSFYPYMIGPKQVVEILDEC